jgi:hypothetical protein
MIGLLAQNRMLLDQFILLTKQSIFSGESLPQSDFRVPMPCQLAFVDCVSSLVSKLAAELLQLCIFEIEIGEQMVTTLILILGGVLLAALAAIYFSMIRRRQRRK